MEKKELTRFKFIEIDLNEKEENENILQFLFQNRFDTKRNE